MSSENTNRIARNTVMLYFRMILMMLVNLYTSRVVLNALGVENFGIYNVVGGIVVMFSFLQGATTTATQRFLNYELGTVGEKNLLKVFSSSIEVHVFIGLICVCIAESIGLWIVCNQLSISTESRDAAIWVYHFSVLTFFVNMVNAPYNAAIIAHEKMGVYAYIAIVEVVMKLLVACSLVYFLFDKLMLYAFLLFIVALIIHAVYFFYCRIHFSECKFKFCWDFAFIKIFFSFSGWMLMGSLTSLLSTQGVNILLNIFFGPLVNAARGIACQVQAAVNSFALNFMVAVNPQIVKSYSQQKLDYMYHLVFASSKFSFFLLFIISIPLLINTDLILTLWLKNVPEYAVLFTRLALIDILFQVLNIPIGVISQASGKVRNYQLIMALFFSLIFVISYIAFKQGAPVYSTFLIAICCTILGTIGRIWVLKNLINFPVITYLKKVMFPVITIFLLSLPILLLIDSYWNIKSTLYILLFSLLIVFLFLYLIWKIGLNNSERIFFIQKFQQIKNR